MKPRLELSRELHARPLRQSPSAALFVTNKILVVRRLSARLALAFAVGVVQAAISSQPMLAQTLTVLHEFTGSPDGGNSTAGLLLDSAGNLYGTTDIGGGFHGYGCRSPYGCGTVFKVSPGGKERILHRFIPGAGGDESFGDLISDSVGNLYGTTVYGGTGNCQGGSGCGVVFMLDRTGKETVLHRFRGVAGGGTPVSGLVRDRSGNLYGVTYGGGDLNCEQGLGCGVVFKLSMNGKERVLHAFTNAGIDGQGPWADLIRDSHGNLYGTTLYGGTGHGCVGNIGCGTVFKVSPAGKETVLYSFTGVPDGEFPQSALLRDTDGNLYGSTTEGGDSKCNCGVVFKLDSSGKETILYTFLGGEDGANPAGKLVWGSAGNIYGTTKLGGRGCGFLNRLGCGTIFELNVRSQTETKLYSFTGRADGTSPYGVVRDAAGNLYGATEKGGTGGCIANEGCGSVFKLTP
jgi:uncharacterized repeat protein (TIGR03803 family)